jgi:cytochrome d ubiquinol oxidase subunit II
MPHGAKPQKLPSSCASWARHRPLWDAAFTIGSLVAALAQGITLGAILQGIQVQNDAYAGGWLDWLSPFACSLGSRW